MKLIVQIPCFNEAGTISETVADIPESIDGIDIIEILIIDDGSSDGTSELAQKLGVHHILRNKRNMGLARTFKKGLDHSLSLGADIIVNTDGDNQYCGADIAKLVQPIIAGTADITIGDRQTSTIEHFSFGKKLLQRFGSWVVRRFSAVDVPDAVSGFRAISREAAFRINIVSSFSYTIEMLIQVGKKGIAFTSVPVRTNPKNRDSRLFNSVFRFIERSGTTLLRMYSMYQPLRVFTSIGLIIGLIGAIPMVRFLYFYLFASGEGKIQSLVLGSAFLIVGVLTFILGLMADLISHNRQLIEISLEKLRHLEDTNKTLLADARSRSGVVEEPAIPEKLEDSRSRQDG